MKKSPAAEKKRVRRSSVTVQNGGRDPNSDTPHTPRKDEEERPKLTARIFYAIIGVVLVLLLRHHAPDEAARARYQKRVFNIIDDVLEWSPTLALSGKIEKPQNVVNTTDPNHNYAGENNASSGASNSFSAETTLEAPEPGNCGKHRGL